MFNFFQYNEEWLLFSQIFQKEVHLIYVHCSKSVKIREISEKTGKSPTLVSPYPPI